MGNVTLNHRPRKQSPSNNIGIPDKTLHQHLKICDIKQHYSAVCPTVNAEKKK